MATVGLIVGGVAADLEQAVGDAARAMPRIEADVASCEAATARALAVRPDLGSAELDHMRADVPPLLLALAEGTRRARVIAGDLSLFARPAVMSSDKVDLAREIDAAITLLEPDLAGRIVVTREVAADLPPVAGDGGAIGQVLLNLLTNAAQAIEGRGSILVRGRAIDGGARVEIAVRDSGKGIAAEHIGNIFEPFFTTKLGGSRGGSGLGLFVSYGIVQRYGGELQVDSELGRGSEFRVLLPAAPGVTTRSH
jgi:two-component system, NtrC family, sensor kinase